MTMIVNQHDDLIELYTRKDSALGVMILDWLTQNKISRVRVIDCDILSTQSRKCLEEGVLHECSQANMQPCDSVPTLCVWFDDCPIYIPNFGATTPDAMITELTRLLSLPL